MRQILPGLLFSILWASAAVATKIGVQVAEPFILASVRLLIAGILMLVYAYFLTPGKHAFPQGGQWRYLIIFALLNTTIFLGAFVLAMQQVSAGIGSLSTATNPLLITLLAAMWLRRSLRWYEIVGILIGITGVILATYPLLQNSYATIPGLIILMVGMVSVSAATVYYARVNWNLAPIVVNGWQVFLGGLLLSPVTLLATDFSATQWNNQFWGSVLWLIGPVSILALQLWFYLVRQDPVRASLWLFLCPIFGFIFSWALLGEPITGYTYAGTAMVIAGLILAQRDKFRRKLRAEI